MNYQILKSLLLLSGFSFKRVIIRTCLLLTMMFVALSVPHFGVILSLVGATTIAGTNFIFPPLFYILLSRQKLPANEEFMDSEEDLLLDPNNEQTHERIEYYPEDTKIIIPLHIKVLLIEIILIGVVGGTASVYSAVSSLIDGSSGFTTACYLNWTVADL